MMAASKNTRCRGGAWCAALNCKNASSKGFRLFVIPKEESRCKQWIQNCRREDLMKKSTEYVNKNCRLCTEHFEDSQFNNPQKKAENGLIWNAVPTLFKVPNPPRQISAKRKMPRRIDPSPVPVKKRKSCTGDTGAHADPDSSWVTARLSSPYACTSTPDCDERQSTTISLKPGPSQLASKDSPMKKKLKKKLKTLQQRNRRMKQRLENSKEKKERRKTMPRQKKEHLMKMLSEYMPPAALHFVSTQIRVAGKKRKGFRWTPRDKALGLTLLHASPKTYKLLRKLFHLPSERILTKIMQKVKIFPGFSEIILRALGKSISSHPTKRLCVLVFDEMSLKENVQYNIEQDLVEGLEDFGSQRTQYAANHATAFMVRGLVHPWKQTVGYVLTSGQVKGNLLKSLLTQCINKVTEHGLEIKAVICDQGSNNRKKRSMLSMIHLTFLKTQEIIY